MSGMTGFESHAGPISARWPSQRLSSLCDEQLQQFERDGFLVGLDVLSTDDVHELTQRLERLGSELECHQDLLYEIEAAWLERPGEVVLHFLGAWRVDEMFHDLIYHPAITHPCAQLLKTPRLRFWHDQVFWKPVRHPGAVPWHQDYAYWTRTAPAAHITMFISVDEMGPDNGGLEYVPGSHGWGLLPQQEFGGDMNALLDSLSQSQRTSFRPEPVILKAGQASIHHSHLVHGSRANTSDRPRRGVVLNFIADGVKVADDSEPLLKGVPIIPAGQPVAGEFFPIVLDLDARE